MFRVDVFVQTIDNKWILDQASFNSIEDAESMADELRFSLYIQLNKKEIKDYRVIVCDETSRGNVGKL